MMRLVLCGGSIACGVASLTSEAEVRRLKMSGPRGKVDRLAPSVDELEVAVHPLTFTPSQVGELTRIFPSGTLWNEPSYSLMFRLWVASVIPEKMAEMNIPSDFSPGEAAEGLERAMKYVARPLVMGCIAPVAGTRRPCESVHNFMGRSALAKALVARAIIELDRWSPARVLAYLEPGGDEPMVEAAAIAAAMRMPFHVIWGKIEKASRIGSLTPIAAAIRQDI